MQQHTCARCSAPFSKTKLTGTAPKYCTTRCKRQAAGQRYLQSATYAARLAKDKAERVPAAFPITCVVCGAQVIAKRRATKFCSVPCTVQGNPRSCSEPGCGKPHRAKGLCGLHYNQQLQTPEQRRPKVTTSCAQCRQPCIKDRGREKRYAELFCSMSCRDAKRARQAELRKLPVLFVGTVVRPEAKRQPKPQPQHKARLWVAGPCARCGLLFAVQDDTGRARYCSLNCSNRVNKHRYRARKKDAYVADVRPARIYARDGWRCQLCRKLVRRHAAAPHPLSPVLDHIIPLAHGGTHEPSNVQCAHWICNSIKRDRIENVQLMLFG